MARATRGPRVNVRVEPRKKRVRGGKRVVIGWAVRGAGAVKSFKKQGTAWKTARQRAKAIARGGRKAEVLVKNRSGKIRARDSYGHDPFLPRG